MSLKERVLSPGGTGDKAAEAMHAIAEAVTQCKFEATNPAADEVVLYKILQVAQITRCLCLPVAADCYCVHGYRSQHQILSLECSADVYRLMLVRACMYCVCLPYIKVSDSFSHALPVMLSNLCPGNCVC